MTADAGFWAIASVEGLNQEAGLSLGVVVELVTNVLEMDLEVAWSPSMVVVMVGHVCAACCITC